ncbi:hypothetical protein [Streptomyces sp. NPDC059979]|uniref:hypothetical protein n=1 Tax=unclassified Streptomyces TaxID=2593676 RepID=UPI00364CE64B
MLTNYGMDSTTPFALCKRMKHGVLAALDHLPRQGRRLELEFTFDPKRFADAAGDAAGDFKDWLLD